MTVRKQVGIAVVVFALGVQSRYAPALAAEDKNVVQMITEAKTSANHQAIAAFYREESTRLQREAKQHADLAKQLVSEAGGQNPAASHHYDLAEHCRKFADAVEKAAQEAQSLAKVHEGIAQSLQK